MVGQVGDGTQAERARPTRVAGGHDFVQIDAGAGHSCAVDDEHRGWCWGHNDEGQLGEGTFANAYEPVPIALEADIAAISAGHAHTCAIVRDTGVVWCWGDDSAGQLGDGANGAQRSNVPVRVLFDEPIAQVRAGFYQTCALTASGEAFCWGSNTSGQNGDGTDSTRHAPVAVQGAHRFRSIAPGEDFVCAVTTNHDDVFCWGANRWGELGESPPTEHHEPLEVDVAAEAVTTSSGPHTVGGARAYACAIRSDRRIACWGGAIPGVRSNGAVPSLIDEEIEFDEIAAGPLFVCGLRSDGYAYCAGAGGSGQLGTGAEDDVERMTPVIGPG